MIKALAAHKLFLGDVVEVKNGKAGYRNDSRPLWEQKDVYDFHVVAGSAEKGGTVELYEPKDLVADFNIEEES